MGCIEWGGVADTFGEKNSACGDGVEAECHKCADMGARLASGKHGKENNFLLSVAKNKICLFSFSLNIL